MTPLPTNPNSVVLLDPQGNQIAEANNIAPDFHLKVVRDRAEFEAEAANKPFDSTRPPQEQQTLSSAASKARNAKLA